MRASGAADPVTGARAPRWAASMADQLFPEFPWNRLEPLWNTASGYPGATIDLSVGAPVDPTPSVAVEALVRAVDAPGYPPTEGTPALREAIVGYLARRAGVRCLDTAMVLPTIGSKEAIGQLPVFLGLGGQVVALPDLGYPTYEIGALSAGARIVRYVDPMEVDTDRMAMMWINSPSNPEGRVLDAVELRALVARARRSGTLLVSDECYLDFGWRAGVTSVLHPEVCGGDPAGLLVVNSLSKRSNLAGYRAGFLAGDPSVIAPLVEYRKHLGQMLPSPVQAAMTAALLDDRHVVEQRARYARRRRLLEPALHEAGFSVDRSEGGLFLWVRREGHGCWEIATRLAQLGIVCVPGELYGRSGDRHVRLSITATDDLLAEAVSRLALVAG